MNVRRETVLTNKNIFNYRKGEKICRFITQ